MCATLCCGTTKGGSAEQKDMPWQAFIPGYKLGVSKPVINTSSKRTLFSCKSVYVLDYAPLRTTQPARGKYKPWSVIKRRQPLLCGYTVCMPAFSGYTTKNWYPVPGDETFRQCIATYRFADVSGTAKSPAATIAAIGWPFNKECCAGTLSGFAALGEFALP
ncbi:MAG: hypothetical protein OXC05_10280 [Halieaceae bacterium]|nr:hypothetical protein [Halieaceae bacterium]